MNTEKKVVIIDYQLGNLFSVKQVCSHLGVDAKITSDKNELLEADYAILPGVGAFGDSMNNLAHFDLVEPLRDFIAAGKPFMGVCLGMQLLFTESEEFGDTKGLGIIEGSIRKIPQSNGDNETIKVPQIQWNKIETPEHRNWENTPLKTCKDGDFMYFVHSYYANPQNENLTSSKTEYGAIKYCSSIIKDNVFACQFHPEKSGENGVLIYKNWLGV
ncbi:imidazole glycerol phosphate synthase subunit HisH [soil metagenome]